MLINDGSVFKLVNHSGPIGKDNFIIRYKRNWIKTTTNEQIIKASLHETLYVVQ